MFQMDHIARARTHIGICTYTYICICIHTYVYMYTYICICIYTYLYIYMHTYLYVYIHIYMHTYKINGARARERATKGEREREDFSVWLYLCIRPNTAKTGSGHPGLMTGRGGSDSDSCPKDTPEKISLYCTVLYIVVWPNILKHNMS